MVEQNTNWEPGGSPQRENSKGGCWKYGAIGCLVIAVLLVIGGYFAYKFTREFLSAVTEEYTSVQPMDLPAVDASEAEISASLERVRLFTEALHQDNLPAPLILTSRDINILINNHPNWKKMAGRAYVTIENNLVNGQISIPLDEFGNKFGNIFENRYLNGLAVIKVSMTEGRPLLLIDSVEVGGKKLPDELMNVLRTTNLFEEAGNKNTAINEVMEKLQSVTVSDGKLVISPKGHE